MKFLRRLISYLFVMLVGFWLATAGILSGTKIGDLIEGTVDYFPDRHQIQRWIDYPKNNESDQSDEGAMIEKKIVVDPSHLNDIDDEDIDIELIEETIFDLVNDLRAEKGLNELVKNENLRVGASVRAQETEESFSHTRPNDLEAKTVLNEEGSEYSYKIFGENLAMGTFYLEETEMAELLFNGWVESEGHYENMIHPVYNETGIGVHFDGEHLYITQLFGSQL